MSKKYYIKTPLHNSHLENTVYNIKVCYAEEKWVELTKFQWRISV